MIYYISLSRKQRFEKLSRKIKLKKFLTVTNDFDNIKQSLVSDKLLFEN
jgi:CO dehydrogenase nickel-insertion accessory protein CooC1